MAARPIKWERIYRDLRQKITSGEYPVGSPLPPYAELEQLYEAGTWVRQAAVYALRDDGLVESHRGVATFVIATPPPDTVAAPAEAPADALRQLLAGIRAAAEAAQDQLAALTVASTDGHLTADQAGGRRPPPP